MDDLERGERIKALREDHHLTQPAVIELLRKKAGGAQVVTLRGYQAWEAGGGIRWDNAKLLADVFDTEPEYLMSGRMADAPTTPDLSLVQGIAREEQLDGVSSEFSVRVDNVEAALERIEASIEQARQEREDQAAEIGRLLAEQSDLLAVIRGLLGMDGEVTLQDRLVEMLREAQVQAGPGPRRSAPQDRS